MAAGPGLGNETMKIARSRSRDGPEPVIRGRRRVAVWYFAAYDDRTLAMKNLELSCPHCGTVNAIPHTERISDRKCSKCRGFISSAAPAGGGTAPPARRRKVWQGAGAADTWTDEAERAARPAVRWPVWFKVAIGGFVALLAVPLFILLVKKNRAPEEPGAPANAKASGAKASDPDPKVPYPQTLNPEWRKAAMELAQKAVSARTVDELLPLLHHEGIPEEQIRKYYADGQAGMLPIGTEIMKVQIPDEDYGEALVVIQYRDAVERNSALLVVERDGRRFVNWPSLVALGEMKLSEFLDRRPATPVQMRLRARRADIYQPPYDDRTRWSCVLLTDPTEVYRIYAYLDRKHPNAWRIEAELPPPRLVAEDNIPLPVNCRLAFTRDDAPKDMVEMTDLMSMSWFDSKSMKVEAGSSAAEPVVPEPPPAR